MVVLTITTIVTAIVVILILILIVIVITAAVVAVAVAVAAAVVLDLQASSVHSARSSLPWARVSIEVRRLACHHQRQLRL